MNERLKMYEGAYEEFEVNFPHLVNKVIGWCPNSRYELIIDLEDGDEVIYDFMSKSIRRYKGRFNDTDEYGEEDKWLLEFSRRLKNQMARQGIPRWELSRMTGISEVMISKYTNAKAAPSSFKTKLIARALSCSSSYLTDF